MQIVGMHNMRGTLSVNSIKNEMVLCANTSWACAEVMEHRK